MSSGSSLCGIVSKENAGLVASAIRKGIEKAKGLMETKPEKHRFEEEKLLSLEWDFEEGDSDWNYCVAQATFSHKEACEFILHCGAGNDGHAEFMVKTMITAGCSPAFMEAYLAAKDAGAVRVLFWK